MGIKQQIISSSAKQHIMGRLLKYGIKVYGQFWRYAFCLGLKHKPMETNKIVFMSHKGKQYSCNPQYICEYLMEKYPGQFQMVWALKEPEKYEFLKEKGIRVVSYESVAHLQEMMTAKIIITNVDAFIYLPRRKGQVVLDTWHGGGAYKTCGFMNPQNLDKIRKRLRFERLYSRINLYLSSSKLFSEQTIRQSRHFKGEILETGMPRNDSLVNQNQPDLTAKVKEYFHLEKDTKLVLYAPTFRSEKENDDFPKPDFAKVEEALVERFGGKWCTLFRQHHFYDNENATVISATSYPDMQELLYAADVLITDYSSSIWDFSLMFKPVFLYCPDLKRYTDERSFYMPIEKWPFVLCKNQSELVINIQQFDDIDYRKKVEEHHRVLGSYERGTATQMVCERICKECSIGQ